MNTERKDTYSRLLEKLQEKYEEMTRYRTDLSWRFFQGKASKAYKEDFDDSSWQKITLPTNIDIRKGDVWLRCKIIVPDEIAGVEVSGSAAKLFSFIILTKTEIFVNSEKALSSEYWTELRGPKIILNNHVKPRDRYVVVIHIFQRKEGMAIQLPPPFPSIPPIQVLYSHIEKAALEIDSFIQELRFAQLLDGETTKKVAEEFNLKIFEKKPRDILDEIEKARKRLKGVSEKAKEFKVHLIAHAHIDMNWLWPWEDTVDTIKNTFTTMVNLMERHPDFHFSHSQAVTYRVAEERFPHLFETIRRYVDKGNWDVTASMWVEADLNMVGTEALVRQLLYARRYVKDRFGVEPKVCWEPDTFGHVWTLPEVLRGSGIKYYYFMRCGKGHPLFWWEAPDRSRVLAFTSVYNNSVTPKNIVDLAMEIYRRYGLKTSMFVYGVGDHGGGATIEDIEDALEIQKKPTMPSVVFSSTQGFFEEVEAQLSGRDIPVVNDELNPIFDGCYTTHSDIKRYNRICERLLVDAERFTVFSGKRYPKEDLHKAWLNMLFNQFHDILDGSGTRKAYVYPKRLAQEAWKIAEGALKDALKNIAGDIRFSKLGVPIVVFNPLSWDRADVVKVAVPKNLIPRKPVVVSGEERAPVQVSGGEVLFLARVPSMGYRTYYLTEGETVEKDPATLVSGENALENEYLRVEVDKDSGTVRSLYDKSAGRFALRRNRELEEYGTRTEFNNLLQVLYELPHPMSAWIIGEISRTENLIRGANVKIVEDGPVKAVIKAAHRYRKSRIDQYVTIYRGVPRIDFYTILDWMEVSNDEKEAPMLKVAFTPLLGRSRATFEIPFGHIERVADGTETPALRWVDLSDDGYGLSLLNDCKYGFDVKGNTIRMTLIRTSYSPDPRPDQGVQEILYSVYPHKGGWREALTFRRGYEINHPLEAVVVKDTSASHGSKPEQQSFIYVKPENVVVSCVKMAEDSDDAIIRLYDATGVGADAEVVFSFDVKEALEVDLMERALERLQLDEGKLPVHLRPFEIKTIRIKTPEQR